MIRMSRQTDYGIVLMTHFARIPEGVTLTARGLAVHTHLPRPTVSKILKLLAREGLLISQRGVKGGYRLSRSPEAISVAHMIHALEGPIAMTVCVDPSPGECEHESSCACRPSWQQINDKVRGALETISLAELSGPAVPSATTITTIAPPRRRPDLPSKLALTD
jgi:FeS assembly SUF system regulator